MREKKQIEAFMRRLTEELSAQERSVIEWRFTEDGVAVEKKLTVQVRQVYACVTEQVKKFMTGKETVVDLNVKLKAVEKRTEDVAYE